MMKNGVLIMVLVLLSASVSYATTCTGYRYLRLKFINTIDSNEGEYYNVLWGDRDSTYQTNYLYTQSFPYNHDLDLGYENSMYPTFIRFQSSWNPNSNAENFECYGSNDQSNWTLLHSETGLITDDWAASGDWTEFTINETPSGSDDSQGAVAYEAKQREIIPEVTEPETPVHISLSCNPVEYGDSVLRPTTTISLNGHFYTFAGKTGDTADWLPDDPGAAGKNTIVGIDSDGDCVRDDIERYIAELLPSSSHKKVRKYMFEYAKWRGYFLKYSDLSTKTAKEISRNLYKANECVRQILGDNTETQDKIDLVFSKFHNTDSRSMRYINNIGLLGGWTTREKIAVSCP